MTAPTSDLVDKIMAFENDKLDKDEIIELFAGLVRTGMAWELQPMYGRIAKQMIADEWISPEGEILDLKVK